MTRFSTLALVASLLSAPLVEGQPLRTIRPLSLKPAQVVRLDLADGHHLTGPIASLDDSLLTIRVANAPVVVRAGDIRAVAVQRRHTLQGALIGAGALSAVVLASDCLSHSEHAECDFDIPIVFGGGIGALVGHAVHSWQVRFPERPPR